MKNMDPDNAQLYKRDYVQKYIRKTEPYHVQKYEKKKVSTWKMYIKIEMKHLLLGELENITEQMHQIVRLMSRAEVYVWLTRQSRNNYLLCCYKS